MAVIMDIDAKRTLTRLSHNAKNVYVKAFEY